MKVSRLAIPLILLAYSATGFYMVGPEEQAVVRRMGKVVPVARLPGLQIDLPWGLSRIDRVRPAQTKRLWIGRPEDRVLADLRQSEFLTGDLNIINVAASVQYHVSDPIAYVLRARRADALLRNAVESELASAIAHNSVDFVRAEGGLQIQDAVLRGAQQTVDRLQLGVTISSVNLESVLPPTEVVDAFRAAADARNFGDQLVHQAEADERTKLATARSEAQELVDRAHVYRDRVVQQARGSSGRFLAMLREYRHAKTLTATRLYLETMERILPRLGGKLIVDPAENVDLNLLRSNGR